MPGMRENWDKEIDIEEVSVVNRPPPGFSSIGSPAEMPHPTCCWVPCPALPFPSPTAAHAQINRIPEAPPKPTYISWSTLFLVTSASSAAAFVYMRSRRR